MKEKEGNKVSQVVGHQNEWQRYFEGWRGAAGRSRQSSGIEGGEQLFEEGGNAWPGCGGGAGV